MPRMLETYSANWCGLSWSHWIPLDADLSAYRACVANRPGFYRVRTLEHAGLAYIGQTSRSLRQRATELKRGVYCDVDSPPWNDPHAAAPVLWAYRHEDRCTFEVSATAADYDKQMRECYEDYLLYRHRIEHGHSTMANHGLCHPLWTRPSNARDCRPASRLRSPLAYPSLPVARGDDDCLGTCWLNLEWTVFHPLARCDAPTVAGVYRIFIDGDMVYFGQSVNLQSRIRTHRADKRFANASISFHLMPGAPPHQLKERETDLIGAYFAVTAAAPMHQYNPEKSTLRRHPRQGSC